MKQGTIAIIRFWFTNGIDYKIRPAIVVSNNQFNREHAYVLAIPITTKSSLSQYTIAVNPNALQLKENSSFIRTDQITPIESEMVLKEMSRADEELLNQIIQKIKSNF